MSTKLLTTKSYNNKILFCKQRQQFFTIKIFGSKDMEKNKNFYSVKNALLQ